MKILLCIICLVTVIEDCRALFREFSLSSKNNVTWTLENRNASNPIRTTAEVPGGVYSDLQKAGIIKDILKDFNDVETRWVAYDSWVYTASFELTNETLQSTNAHLVLHGVDTVSYVEVNGIPVGGTNNMFVRYVFDVKSYLTIGANIVKISFASPIETANVRSDKHYTAPSCVPKEYNGECHANQLRKMQASFSWDWGPAFPSVGIWKPIVIEFFDGAIIRSITTNTVKDGKNWLLNIVAHIETEMKMKQVKGYVSSLLSVDAQESLKVGKEFVTNTRDDGTAEIQIDMKISEDIVTLWWPNGYGKQPLYDLHVYVITDEHINETTHKHIKIGFRTVELVEENASVKFGNTTAGQGLLFYFKVNGKAIFMKGSNWIPAHILPEQGANESVVDDLLTSAASAHMAMLRVWGGGVYESDYFYRRCDELGILIWQDFLFACSMYPTDADFLGLVQEEIEQNVIRLQSHPSIAVWAGNNENEVALRGDWYDTEGEFKRYLKEYVKLYVDTIRPIVTNLDPGRRYLVSSPSNGLESEKEGYVAQNPYDPHYGDTHYYNYLSDNWDANNYPKTRFASEYGFQSLPSLETIKSATSHALNDLKLNSTFMKHRQHSPNGYIYIENQINRHFKLDKKDPQYFKKFSFYSQITQAMAMKTETEFYRQSQADWYTMGALYWQLNDVWQAPSWSGIEYGGKWKILQYFAKSFFDPVLVSPRQLLTGDVEVYLINDRFVPINDGLIRVDKMNWTSFVPIVTTTYPASVGALSSKKQNIKIIMPEGKSNEVMFLRFSLIAEGVKSSPFNYVFPTALKNIKGLRQPNIKISVAARFQHVSDKYYYKVSIFSDSIILFLWLEAEGYDGRFEDNGMILTKPYTITRYISKSVLKPIQFQKSIKYQCYLN